MPHLIIEYSKEIKEAHSIDSLMDVSHKAALSSNLFSEQDIKVRAYACDHALVAGKTEPFLHVTIKMLSGRSHDIKQKLLKSVASALSETGLDVSSLSVEAIDIERENYSKIVRT